MYADFVHQHFDTYVYLSFNACANHVPSLLIKQELSHNLYSCSSGQLPMETSRLHKLHKLKAILRICIEHMHQVCFNCAVNLQCLPLTVCECALQAQSSP